MPVKQRRTQHGHGTELITITSHSARVSCLANQNDRGHGIVTVTVRRVSVQCVFLRNVL